MTKPSTDRAEILRTLFSHFLLVPFEDLNALAVDALISHAREDAVLTDKQRHACIVIADMTDEWLRAHRKTAGETK